ncbi:hypothetical protein AB205_0141990, partial [Aquarana catesbeiana]
DAQIYEELFNFACPKFLSPVVPNYDNVHPNYHKEPYLQQLKVFLDEVQQQAQLSTIRSFLKLYTTMPVAKLAGFLDLPEQEFRIQLLVFKHKMKNLVWTSGISALEGEFQSASEVDFYIDKGYKLFNRFPNSRCSFTVAEWHGYTSEEAYTFLSMTDESEEELAHLSDSGSEYKPIDSSGTLTDGSDDGVVVPAKVQEPQGSRMEQRVSTSAAHPSGELASTSDLVHPDCTSSTAVTLGDMASPMSAVQAGEVASTTSVPQPPRRQRQARRAHSALPAAFANLNWEPTTSAAPVLPPFTGQSGIQVETVDFTSLDFYPLFFTEDLYRSIVDQSDLEADMTVQIQTVTGVVEKPLCVHEYNLNMGGVDPTMAPYLIAHGAVAQLPDLNAVSGVHERHFPPCYPYPKKSPKKMSCLQKMRI